jgi:hypothetical protein
MIDSNNDTTRTHHHQTLGQGLNDLLPEPFTSVHRHLETVKVNVNVNVNYSYQININVAIES